MPTIDHWRATWNGLGVCAPEDLFHQLVASYGEPHRKYHTIQHLDECFSNFSEVRSQATFPEAIELAIWFHDSVYDPKSRDNEEKSAEWARSAILKAGVPESMAEKVFALVISTRHDRTPEDSDARILVDVDLAILAAPAGRFDEYERQVREEYAWAPDRLFKRERKKIINSFLESPSIFSTDHFRHIYEIRARKNLQRSLVRLEPSKPSKLKPQEIAFYVILGIFTVIGIRVGISHWMIVVLAVILAVAYTLIVEPKLRSKGAPIVPTSGVPVESRYSVRCTDEEIAVSLEGHLRERCRWDDIVVVGIRIDDSFLPQPWWIVGGETGGCMFPSDSPGWEAALHEMSRRLPGFDHTAVIKAAGMMSGGVVVWQKEKPK